MSADAAVQAFSKGAQCAPYVLPRTHVVTDVLERYSDIAQVHVHLPDIPLAF